MTRATGLLATIVLAATVLAACGTSDTHRRPGTVIVPRGGQDASIDPAITQYLLTAAATDLKTHAPSYPARVRDVRIGYLVTPDGGKEYTLCGQFLPHQETSQAEWIPFATTKTSGYEQVIGGLAATLCQRSSIMWRTGGDLSSSLQGRLESPPAH